MAKRFSLFTWTVIALVLCSGIAVNAEDADVDQSTESPIADMALVDSSMTSSMSETAKQQAMPDSAQPHTIADFIIHPLIALKPRAPEEAAAEGKQAASSTTPAPWQLFGFNNGQTLGLGLGSTIGSSVQSLAGTVSGWLGNRVQLPGLIETPVSENTTTTSTTQRPDVVVRVQHRPTTRRPLIQFNDESRPHRFSDNNLYDSEEYGDEYDDEFDNDYRQQDEYDDEPEFDSQEEEEDDPREEEEEEEEEEEDNRPVRKQKPKKRRPSQGSSSSSTSSSSSSNKKKSSKNKKSSSNKRKRPQPQESEEEVEDEETEVEDDDDNDQDQDFYYSNNNNHGSTKRSQSQQGFIQLGQQSLLNQIRQLTRGQTPADVASTVRKTPSSNTNSAKRRQQATLIINRNGQTVYLAPELMNAVQGSNVMQQVPFYTTGSNSSPKQRPVANFPQPPLTVPYKRKGQPTQYITIPWSQLGISPPSQLVSVTEGIQSQPLILNIPQSALSAMQSQRPSKRKPVITSEAVPLLAEASLMDVFKPPQIPPARTPSSGKGTKTISSSVTPVLISTKNKQRIRPGTIVEMAPDMDSMRSQQDSMAEDSNDHDADNQFLVVGDDAEPGLGRQAYPGVGENRQYHALNPYYNLFQNRQYRVRNGRQLMAAAEVMPESQMMDAEKMMPEKIEAEKMVVEMMEADKMVGEKIEAEKMAVEQKEVEKMEAMPASEAPAVMAEPAQDIPIVPSEEKLIPVQVITSESEVVKSPEVVAKPEEPKTE